MHSTEHKKQACQIAPWSRAGALRVCEHGDSAYKAARKRTARQKRRQSDKKETEHE